ncbi:MAG: hypothetical protein Tsb0015_08120 [Simkaniaceae bacterium]
MSLHPLFKTPYNNKYDSLAARKKETEERLKSMVKDLNGELSPDDVFVKFSKKIFTIPHSSEETIYLPSLCLLAPQEFPPPLKISGPDDPKLDDDGFLNQLIFWIECATKSKVTGSLYEKKKIDWKKREYVKQYIRLMQDAGKAQKAFDWILGHELGHIVMHHKSQYPDRLSTYLSMDIPSLMTSIISSLGLMFLFSLDFGKTLETFVVQYFSARFFSSIFQSQKNEHEADIFGLRLAKEIEGPKYLFETEMIQMQKERHALPFYLRWMVTPSGNFFPLALTHGFSSSRVKLMQNAISKLLLSKQG